MRILNYLKIHKTLFFLCLFFLALRPLFAQVEGPPLTCSLEKALAEYEQGRADHQNLFLLQTQRTALKLASLIDIHQRPQSNQERLQSMERVRRLSSPLPEDNPLALHFKKYEQTQLLVETWDYYRQALAEGKMAIPYEEMPHLLMALEASDPGSRHHPLFDESDFAVAWFWKESADGPNRLLEELARVYHEWDRDQREELFHKLTPQWKQAWEELKEKLHENGCFRSPAYGEEFQDTPCSLPLSESLAELAPSIDELNSQVMEVLSFQVSGELKDEVSDAFRFKLHPPPEREDLIPPENVAFKNFNGRSYTEYRSQRSYHENLEAGTNLQLIKNYHLFEDPRPYLLLDKEKERLFYFDEEGKLLASFNSEEDTGDHRGDSGLRGTEGLGAGIYNITEANDLGLELKDERQRHQFLTLGQTGVDCLGETCSQTLASPEDIFKRHGLTPPIPLYIIPKNEKLEFVIKNNRLSFTTYEKLDNYFRYNFTPKQTKAIPTRFEVTNEDYDNDFTREFLEALEEEKQKLMNLYGLDNDEYNELVILSFGILGQESQFGNHWRYKVKETFPGGVAYLKNYQSFFREFSQEKDEQGFLSAVGSFVGKAWDNEVDYLLGRTSTKQNSRGPTQIKTIPKKIQKAYDLTDKEKLQDPKKAAVATLGFLAQSLEELKAKEKFHPSINGRNRFEYLHYIYMGLDHEITRGTATPDKNIYFQNVLRYAKDLQIWQDTPSLDEA